ncbi:MAG: phosphoketolase [Microbacterium sp. 67-17]|uniref:phosphoketolase family protein n=1 Tax=Microbacterium sp. 67-17 TaxID=1895782 RepID=UPI00095D561A|nr:phosphoketolase family protein [Microbacterium sp. 67-17]OJW00557.1 MAG: phosphoketolase [Microbacterium sp. 67-17]
MTASGVLTAITEQTGKDALVSLDAWWRAATYLSVGQIYLRDNPLLRRPLEPEDIKPRLLGHFGTVPGLTLVYGHLNRVIAERGIPMLFIAGPGHGGPAMNAVSWLEGPWSATYPDMPRSKDGMRELFSRFSAPVGIPSHTSPHVPGSIQEGGELGYSLVHAYGAALDDPDVVVACVIGDGEAETAALSASWQSAAFLDPRTDGAVLPILHLNGWKIDNPTVMDRMPEQQLRDLMSGHGHDPIIVDLRDATDPIEIHSVMAHAMDRAFDLIAQIQRRARGAEVPEAAQSPRWPMIVLRSRKGWTGPEEVDGEPVEGTWRSHQVPLEDVASSPERLAQVERWLRSYRPDDLFDERGVPTREVRDLVPEPMEVTMSGSSRANGGLRRRDLVIPELAGETVENIDRASNESATTVFGEWLGELVRANPRDLRIFAADELRSNRLAQGVLPATARQWNQQQRSVDEDLATQGRVMEVLSEHLCQGWLEGYVLTGRHGLFTSYEAFVHVVDSMFNQYAKWLEAAATYPWRAELASFTYLLSSHVWRQDHNGFTHQDPGFLDLAARKSSDIVRLSLPPDANTLLVTMERAFTESGRINVVVAGKQPEKQWFSLDAARRIVADGAGILPGAGSVDDGTGQHDQPDIVLACSGDVPTQEADAARALVRELAPFARIRVVTIVDLLRLRAGEPQSLDDDAFATLFGVGVPLVFVFHGYPHLIKELLFDRPLTADVTVRGYHERGSTTTPFDMLLQNEIDRFTLAADVLKRCRMGERERAEALAVLASRREHAADHLHRFGVDHPALA